MKDKIFRDSVHGYIRIPEIIVDRIIDTEVFQRLRHIEQTSMRPLYPAARHDRFSHSLGTYHLGCKAFSAIRNNVEKSGLRGSMPSPCCCDEWWQKHYYLFAIACLLHDCAHAPFSHTLELFYDLEKPTWKIRESDFDGEINRLDSELLVEYGAANKESGRFEQTGDAERDLVFRKFREDFIGTISRNDRAAAHERMSALVVGRHFRERIGKVFEGLAATGLVEESYGEFNEADADLVARMIMGCPYECEASEEDSLKNCFIGLLNSSMIDVDGLDYTMRDTLVSGLDNWSIDCDRLLGSLSVVEGTRIDGCYVENASFNGVWLAGSKLEASSCYEALLRVCGAYNVTFSNKRGCAGLKKISGCEVKEESHSDKKHLYMVSGNGGISEMQGVVGKYSVELTTCCKTKFDSWSGMLTGTVLLPENELPAMSEGSSRKTYAVTYAKSSISVIEGAVDARNQFHRWVYSHPQVVYYSVFLQKYLLKMSAIYLCCKNFNGGFAEMDSLPERCDENCPAASNPARKCRGLVCEVAQCSPEKCSLPPKGKPLGQEDAIVDILGLEGYYNPRFDGSRSLLLDQMCFTRSTDDDINALFKFVYLDNKSRPEEKRFKSIELYFGEYFSRPKCHPIWKSLEGWKHLLNQNEDWPEFDFDFEPLSADKNLPGAKSSLSSLDYVFVGEDDKIAKTLLDAGYKEMVAVNASRKLKGVDYTSTLVAFPDSIERLIDVLDPSEKKPAKEKFVYVYARTVPADNGEGM